MNVQRPVVIGAYEVNTAHVGVLVGPNVTFYLVETSISKNVQRMR